MWGQDTGKNEYIYDCESLQLAVKVGIFGIIIGYIHGLIVEFYRLYYFSSQTWNVAQFTYIINLSNFLSFPWLILTSLGYVGIFALKRSNLGVVFPLLTLTNIVATSIAIRVIFALDLASTDIYYTFSISLSYIILIIGVLLLLSIRNRTENIRLLYTIVILRLTGGFLLNVISIIFFGELFSITGVLGYLIINLPRLILNLVTTALLATFFIRESRAGYFEEDILHFDSE
ncbi:MAG: hypothetical protein E4H14_15565 [Candidatus Thorarchaeota archaeon]|nr:MAG: hypothetical protein E4H14_15565 [Candidatus Thorarchaeota archaeon]